MTNLSHLLAMQQISSLEADRARSDFRALVFDFDGLIVDTESPDYHSWREIYEVNGCALPEEVWCADIGLGAADTRFHPFNNLQAQVAQVLDEAQTQARRRVRYLEMVQAQPILPGVKECIAAAKALGMKLAVASSSDCEWVTRHLLRLNLFHSFDAIKCADHVRNTKPHPELYLAAVKALGVAPNEAVAFEDSAHGVTAAKAAGLFAVAIPNPMTHRLPLAHADLRLRSLSDLPLPDLLKRLRAEQTIADQTTANE